MTPCTGQQHHITNYATFAAGTGLGAFTPSTHLLLSVGTQDTVPPCCGGGHIGCKHTGSAPHAQSVSVVCER